MRLPEITSPVRRLRQSILTDVPTWPVTKSLSPQMIGDEGPEGRGGFPRYILLRPERGRDRLAKRLAAPTRPTKNGPSVILRLAKRKCADEPYKTRENILNISR